MGISFHETTIYSIDFNRSMPHWGLSKNGCAPFSCASDMAIDVSSLCCLKICSTWPNHNFAGENSGENWKIHPKNPQLSSVILSCLCQFSGVWQGPKRRLPKGPPAALPEQMPGTARWDLSFYFFIRRVLKNNKCFLTILRITNFSIESRKSGDQ